jgi:hypothetical protein
MANPTVSYLDLQDRCLTYGYGEVDRNNFKVWINQSYMEVVGSWRWSWLEASTTLATVAGTQTYAVPTDMLTFGKLVPDDTAAPFPEYTDQFDFRRYMSVNDAALDEGIPTHFTLANDLFVFYPVPDAVYNYLVLYWAEPPPLSADIDLTYLSDSDVDIIVLGALARAAQRENDMGRYQVYATQFTAQLAQMVRTEKLSQAQTIRRAALPASYGGLYDTDF